MGSGDGMEKSIVRKKGYRFKGIKARPLIRKLTPVNLINAALNIRAVFESASIIKKFRPDFVVGTGGFVSFPVVFSAAVMKVRTLIHEPNMVPGLANRGLGRVAGTVTAGFEETKKYFPAGKVFITGNPVRESVKNRDKKPAYRRFKLSPKRRTLLIMPGSRAAKNINRVVLASLAEMEARIKNLQLLWMCGSGEYKEILGKIQENGYKTLPIRLLKFIDDAGAAYAIADAAILRAGASTLSEIAAVRQPAILVPYPHATGNHQEKNAEVFRRRKVAFVIKDGELGTEALLGAVKKILDRKRNAAIRKNLKYMDSGDSVKNITDIITGDNNA